MKFSAMIVAVAAAVVCLANPAASESEAVRLRVHVSHDKSICYNQCSSGQYCANAEPHVCRAPKSGECFNPATGAWRQGCDPGFKCSNGKCVYN